MWQDVIQCQAAGQSAEIQRKLYEIVRLFLDLMVVNGLLHRLCEVSHDDCAFRILRLHPLGGFAKTDRARFFTYVHATKMCVPF